MALRDKAAEIYGVKAKQVFIYCNGRSAMLAYLSSLKGVLIPKDGGDDLKIGVISFTCSSAVSPVLWSGNKPCYIETDLDTLSVDLSDLEVKLVKLDLVIVQHSFGIPANMAGIKMLCETHGVRIIEDCAHAFGDTSIGKAGDAMISSFGIEKVLNTKIGGFLIVNDMEQVAKVDGWNEGNLENFGLVRSLKWFLMPYLWVIVRQLRGLGKYAVKLGFSLGLLSDGYESIEHDLKKPNWYPSGLPKMFERKILKSINGLENIRSHRSKLVDLYSSSLGSSMYPDAISDNEQLSLIKFPVILDSKVHREIAIAALREAGCYVTDWYNHPLYPSKTNLEEFGYELGECPVAQDLADRVLNLPTAMFVQEADAKKYCDILNSIVVE